MKDHNHTPPHSARKLAVDAVLAVTKDGLPLELPEACNLLSPRDRGLAFEVATGTVRFLSLLETMLTACMLRPLAQKHHGLRAIMLTALYQARFMRVPNHAVVHEAVELVKKSPDRALAGFANAVLRKAVDLDLNGLLANIADPCSRLAVATAHPEWLVKRWLQHDGEAITQARLHANNQMAPLTLRVNPLVTDKQTVITALSGQNVVLSSHSPEAIMLPKGGSVESLPGYRDGWFSVQDLGAQWISRLLAPQPGERILDACAAPGGKTAHLAELTQGQAMIVAIDKSAQRLKRFKDNMRRLHIPNVRIEMGDAGDAGFLPGRQFAKALVDVPCTGTGVIRRHPDIKWRRGPEDPAKMAAWQKRILNAVATRVCPGGHMVYATCSMESEENEAQIALFLQENPSWRRLPIESAKDGILAETITELGDFHTEPGMLGMDGFYAARLQLVD